MKYSSFELLHPPSFLEELPHSDIPSPPPSLSQNLPPSFNGMYTDCVNISEITEAVKIQTDSCTKVKYFLVSIVKKENDRSFLNLE